MEKERKEVLEWFVQFANMNLEELKPGDRAKLLIESGEYLSPKKDIEQFSPPPLDRPKDYPAYLRFLGKMAWAFSIPPRDAPEYWNTLKDLQKAVIEAFRILGSFSELSSAAGSAGFGWRGETLIRTAWNRTFNLSFFPLAETLGIYVELKLYQLLNGFPFKTIEECQGCKKYFLNATFRKKRFCSPRCMWRFNSAKRRDANPEGYREYQRELMRDRYREKNGHRRLKTKSRKAKKGE